MSNKVQSKSINPILNVDNLKNSAKRLTSIMQKRNVELKHSESLELMSQIEGFKDYNTFVAVAKNTNNNLASAEEAKKDRPVGRTYLFTGKDVTNLVSSLNKLLFFYEDAEGRYLTAFEDTIECSDENHSLRHVARILICVNSRYFNISKTIFPAYDSEDKLFAAHEILKEALLVFKSFKLSPKMRPITVPIVLSGTFNKHFCYGEITASYTTHSYNKSINQEVPMSFSIRLAASEYIKNPSISLIVKKGDEVLFDQGDKSIDINETLKKIKTLTSYKPKEFDSTDIVSFLRKKAEMMLSIDSTKFATKTKDSLVYVIKAFENYMKVPGLYNALLEQINNSVMKVDYFHTNHTYLDTLSQSLVTQLLLNRQSKQNEFSIKSSVVCFNLTRVLDDA